MGLNPGDLAKIPTEMAVKECYERIYNWHKQHGESRVKVRYGRDDEYSKTYLDLVKALPVPNKATQEDMDFIFGQVTYMLMEWSYHEEDEHGIKMGAYAQFALDKEYSKGFHDAEFRKSRDASKLATEFAYPKHKEKGQ